MNNIEAIYELVDKILPAGSTKTIMFCEIEPKAYEIFYYSYFADNSCKQCYELVDENVIDGSTLDMGFEKIASIIRESDKYDPEKRNVITVTIEGTLEKIKVEQFDKSVGLYKIKKDWKAVNL